MDQRTHRIRLARNQYKFSCAHMTVFPDGTKERLHGHNYFVAVTLDLTDISLSKILPFGDIKQVLGALCQEWKEHTLLARDNPFFEVIRHGAEEYEFKLCGKRYVLPAEDVMVLPIDNVAVEPLSDHFATVLAERLRPLLPETVTGLELEIYEVPGQGASTYLPLTQPRSR